jgi:hypothetical protein
LVIFPQKEGEGDQQMTEEKKELTIDNLRPEMREEIRLAMLQAIHNGAHMVLRNQTHYIFALAVNGKGPFSVDHVWKNLPANTRDHFVNHSLFAVDAINAELGPGRKPAPAAIPSKPAAPAPAAGYREHEDAPAPAPAAKTPAAPIPPPPPVVPAAPAVSHKKKHHR